MNAMKAAQLILTVSGVFVNVTMDIPRNGVDVKVTGEQFHKDKFNRSDQVHLIHSNHVAPPQIASLWI